MSLVAMREKFEQVDASFGPLPFWWWSAETVTEERVKWQLNKFRQGGLRNIGIINIAPTGPQYGSVPDDPAYFSEQWWKMFEVALREAEKLGMKLFFYDQIGFSGSNFPARIVAEQPQYTGYVLKRYKDKAQIPEGSDYLTCIDTYHYVAVRQGFNWLDPAACALLLDKVHGEFERRFSPDLGRTIGGTFQDELPPLNLWTGNMDQLFEERYGTSIYPLLPALFEETDDAREVRQNIYELASDLAESSFFKPIAAWHRRFDMLLCCDQAGPARKVEVHGAQRLYLDYMKTHRWYNASGTDMDGEIKPHASMVHLHGGKRVFLEAFHTSGWGGTLEETMHWLIPWFQAGVTLYSSHAVYFSTRGGWWEWAPPDTGWRQPYFEHYAVFANTISRVTSLLSEGTHVADIAVHYPSYAATGKMSLSDGKENEHPMAVASRLPNDKLAHIQEVYDQITGKWGRRNQDKLGLLRSLQYDFDVVDDSSLGIATVDGKQLQIAEERFSLLILCGTIEMDQEASSKVTEWIQQGGRVIAVNVPHAERIAWSGIHYVDTMEEAGQYIQQHVSKRVCGAGTALMRTTNEADIFLLLPDQDALLRSHEPVAPHRKMQSSGVYRIKSAGIPEQWDPVSGAVTALPYERDGAWLTVEVSFEQWPAALIVCSIDQNDKTNIDAGDGGNKLKEHAEIFPADTGVIGEHAKVFPADTGVIGEQAVAVTLPNQWKVKVKPTLDNSYGDFDLHGQLSSFLAVERRQFQVWQQPPHRDGIAEGWHLPSFNDEAWHTRLWTEAAYWYAAKGEQFHEVDSWPVVYSNTLGDMKFRTWAGRMGRVPRRFLNLGTYEKGEYVSAKSNVIAPTAGQYFIRMESNAELRIWINGKEINCHGGPEEQTSMVLLQAGANEIIVQAKALVSGIVRLAIEFNQEKRTSLPKWVFSKDPHYGTEIWKQVKNESASRILKVSIVFAGRGRGILTVNGVKVTEHGDFNPYIRQGQELVDVTHLWNDKRNMVKFILPEGKGEVFCDGVIEYADGKKQLFCTGEEWQDEQGQPVLLLHQAVLQFAETETLWLNDRPHPLPHVGWLMPNAVSTSTPLPFHPSPALIGEPVWIRFPLPVGAEGMEIKYEGELSAWLDGEKLQITNGLASFPAQKAGAIVALCITPQDYSHEAAVLLEPIRFVMGEQLGELGDWRTALQLPHYSGVVEYETTIAIAEECSMLLDIGHVRGTAEVWIDDHNVGVRLWRPYRYNLGKLSSGNHRLRIRVTNTLGTHYEIGRPSYNVGGNLDRKVSYWANPDAIDSNWEQQFAAGGLYGPVQIFQSQEQK
ncbi:hypothetical protein ACFSTH_02985 [Paenibacillus yanchengensis]|uniref:Alpha-L-rhamnosidase n=1 Tax=Paenibacillus yanchengensis TaxID=2035833 RepID=A0ABW4YG20_9BACL